MMSWRGLYSDAEQYFRNDVAVSPLNFASYILQTLTSTIGNGDPSTDTNWIELSVASTAVNTVIAGTGIAVTGPTTTPTVSNTGVLAVTAGAGITNTGTATDPNLVNTGVISVVAGSGISVNNANPQLPVITNTGIVSLIPGVGIDIPPRVGSEPPVINNTGVLSILAGINIDVNRSTGIVAISANTGFIGNLTPAPPSSAFAMLPSPCPFADPVTGDPGIADITFIVSNPSLFVDYLANGSPNFNGIFMINTAGMNLYFSRNNGAPTIGAQTVEISFFQAGSPSIGYSANTQIVLSTSAAYPVNATFPLLYFSVRDARAAGMTFLSGFVIKNHTISQIYLLSAPTITYTYYPNGLE